MTRMNTKRKIAYRSGPVEVEVKLWQHAGVRLMTHHPVGPLGPFGVGYRVSEESTGYGVPNTFADSETKAEALAAAEIDCNRVWLESDKRKHPVLNPPFIAIEQLELQIS